MIKLKEIPPPELKDIGEKNSEVNSLRQDELDRETHKFRMFLRKKYKPFSVIIFAFIILLFFIILPISEMEQTHINKWDLLQDYCNAFISSGKVAFISITTIIISDLLSKTYKYMKENI